METTDKSCFTIIAEILNDGKTLIEECNDNTRRLFGTHRFKDWEFQSIELGVSDVGPYLMYNYYETECINPEEIISEMRDDNFYKKELVETLSRFTDNVNKLKKAVY